MPAYPPPVAPFPEPADRGARARERLLQAASRIFAEKGFARASTREICHAAELNVAAINYHFGSKEGLYREVLLAPVREIAAQFAGCDAPDRPLPEVLRQILGAFVLDALDPQTAQMMQLHLREMAEPSAGYVESMVAQVRPHHDAVAALVARHIGLNEPDEAVHQLVLGLVAMAQDFSLSACFYQALAPALVGDAQALHRALDRLVDWGCALIAHERQRRAHPAMPGPCDKEDSA